MRFATLSLALLAFVALSLEGARAARAEPDLPLHWTSPATCPDASAVMRSSSELMDVASARWGRFRSIRGRLVALSSGGFELELVFEGPSSTRVRRFRVHDCRDAADLAATALALALDPRSDGLGEGSEDGSGATAFAGPEGSAGSPDAASGPAEPTSSSLRVESSRDGARSEDRDRASGTAAGPIAAAAAPVPIAIAVGLGGLLDPSGLGAVGFGGSAWGTARRAQLSLSLHADWLPQASLELGARTVQLGLTAAGLRLCYAPSAALGVCRELEAGWLRASGAELDNGRSARDPWLAPGASVELRAPLLDALSAVSRVTLLAPLVRSDYLVNDGELLHRTPPVVLRLSLGVELPVR